VPSLFSFTVADEGLRTLQGLVVEDSIVFLPGTKLRAEGPLLITHWGLSGPAILKLSSYAARHLADCGYRSPLAINWLSKSEAEVRTLLVETSARQPQKMLTTFNPFGLPQRLWVLIVEALLTTEQKLQRLEALPTTAAKLQRLEALPTIRWGELGKKDMNRLVNALTNYTCQIEGRAPFKDEFVTCGGVCLNSVNPLTLESRFVPHLYFAGEVLDIDGITGGFNFQAAWTTAFTVAAGIAKSPLSGL
jgi:predicted flavoprotein YhiN